MSEQAVKKRQLSPTAQIAVAVVALLLVAAVGWFLVVSPKRSAAASLDEEIAALEQQIAVKQGEANKPKPEVVRAADLFRLAKAMPDDADMAGVILELNRIAKDTGIAFESITPQGAVVEGEYQVLSINLAFDGNFYSLSDFLFRLRNLVTVRDGALDADGRLFAVKTLNFGQGAGGFPEIKADLTIDAFVYGTGVPAAAPPPAPAPPGTDTTSTTTTPATTTPAPADPSTPPAPATAAPAPGATS